MTKAEAKRNATRDYQAGKARHKAEHTAALAQLTATYASKLQALQTAYHAQLQAIDDAPTDSPEIRLQELLSMLDDTQPLSQAQVSDIAFRLRISRARVVAMIETTTRFTIAP